MKKSIRLGLSKQNSLTFVVDMEHEKDTNIKDGFIWEFNKNDIITDAMTNVVITLSWADRVSRLYDTDDLVDPVSCGRESVLFPD